jgi:hypothetical protein
MRKHCVARLNPPFVENTDRQDHPGDENCDPSCFHCGRPSSMNDKSADNPKGCFRDDQLRRERNG